MTQSDPRLPTHVVPSRYQIELEPDLDSATFFGSVAIDVEILEATDEIVCNAVELDIKSVSIVPADGSRITPEYHLNTDTERLHLTLATDINPGPAHIELAFSGILNDRLRGFYRSRYKDEDGLEQTIATTQFQSTDARRAFPCWDEPAYKATFATTLVVDQDHLAISNTAVVRESSSAGDKRRFTFAETMPMSTYLVAFVVGPLELTEPTDVDGVGVRVVHRPGQGHLTAFALDVASHALRWFSEYYAIPYPSDKVDLVAIPDFAFGAMENLGCVTFREVLLLIDPESATQPELQTAAAVINHELAHMWFGDLVTMKWWEGIWLNEAFATFMEVSCSDAYRPDWDVWTTFCRGRSAAFATDALKATRPIEYPVVTPSEAEGMFDILTYEKGASVVRMLEQHLGAERFRDGVRHYLTTHAYANTETGDLWDSLETTSGEPVRRIMDGWIYQGGYPLVELTETAHGAAVSQRPFALDPAGALDTSEADDRTWAVPLRMRGSRVDRNDSERFLLDGPAATLTGSSIDDFVTANADASGFFRVRPNPRMIAAAVSGELTPSERHAVVDDAWALTVAGRMSAQAFLETALRFVDENDLAVWQALAGAFGTLRRFVDGDPDSTSRYTRDVGELARGALDRIGLQPADTDDDTGTGNDRVRELRATLVSVLGTVADDPEIITASPKLRHHSDATLAAAALGVVAHNGGRSEFNEIRAASTAASDPQTEQRNLRALADFRDTTLADELLEAIVSGAVRTQDGPYLIRRALTNQTVGGHVWAFVASHWDLLTTRFPSNSVARMLEGIVMLDTSDQVAAVSEFLAAHPVPQGSRQVAQHLERQRINSAFRSRVQQSEFWLRAQQ
ncbi:MAG: M1 family metallopeptidase [Acidimicrobiaceae bacterium]|nr:M1 family metallopeptidase [Acidimicrobiaceae bacterium]MYA75333.1 M1 family metallopeptidase [Acidimicrobiaceae bacterium]MYC41958.1 M1 family metallopeptidase [Acidimicrobiaceae bacterium]MYG54657.1 M1 family metallopeptidase [Acidimicrobiaceae bacterium]MYJ98058.1 M1 family metallopeptidase [Acidimicrobiaceae bacterium]